MQASRNVWAIFAEASVPITKSFEATVAVRHDQYDDVGGSTNPKLSLRWEPTPSWLFRASVGTGFRPPGLEDLHAPPVPGVSSTQTDSARCRVTGSPNDCNHQFPNQLGGNPLLKNEKSSQWGVGVVWSPARALSLGLDYFNVVVDQPVALLSGDQIFRLCPDGVNGVTCQFIHRGDIDPAYPNLPGRIVLVDQTTFNAGTINVIGVDISAQYILPKLGIGQFTLSFQGTYIFNLEFQTPDGTYSDFVSHETSIPSVVPHWRHYLTLDWKYGPWGATLTENFQRRNYDAFASSPGASQRIMGDYDIWSVSGFYTGFKNWTLSAGVKNLMDRSPPFSNQTRTSSGTFQSAAGYDPTYTDPRGRLYWAGIKYVFK
jgi:iron complex outermembrane receptor protein